MSVADGGTSDAMAFPHVTLPIHDAQQRTMRSTTSEGFLITIDPTSNLLVRLRYVTSPVPGKLLRILREKLIVFLFYAKYTNY